MPIWPGRYEGKRPTVSLVVAGTRGSPEQFDVVVDSGFGGFLMMSKEQAAQHGFPAGPAQMGTMADRSRVALATALANVGFAGRSHQGIVTITPEHVVCLVGIDFLRIFRLALVLTSDQLWLMDEPEFERIALNSGARIASEGPSKSTDKP